eukprot:6436236-Prorocentrum_lima.AAC.1
MKVVRGEQEDFQVRREESYSSQEVQEEVRKHLERFTNPAAGLKKYPSDKQVAESRGDAMLEWVA